MSGDDLGGDAPCWAHLLDDDTQPIDGEAGRGHRERGPLTITRPAGATGSEPMAHD